MKRSGEPLRATGALLAAALLAAPQTPGSAPESAPEPAAEPVALVRTPAAGEAYTLRSRQTLRLELVEYETSIVSGGEESEPQTGPPVELVREQDELVVFRDELLATEGARATRFRRRFQAIETVSVQKVRRTGAAEHASRELSQSPLEGRAVLFEWDPERARHRASFDADGADPGAEAAEADDGLLARLEARADLAWFLPPHPVAVGERWSVDPATFALLSSPSGELVLRVDGRPQPPEFGRRFHEELAGTIEARYAGERSTEAGAWSSIRIAAALETEFELGGPAPGRAGPPGDRYRFRFELEGELRWDRAAGRGAGIELAGPVELRLETRRPLEEVLLLTRQRLAGRMEIRVELR